MDWPHAPVHRLELQGTYMVTAATYERRKMFAGPDRLDFLMESLFKISTEFGWRLQAWAIFANHYHFIALAPEKPGNLVSMIRKLHACTARKLNQMDEQEGRKVWFNYWDSLITYHNSYLARLNYVHTNPVRHGLVELPSAYPWCSAGWFERSVSASFRKTIYGFKTDRLSVVDDF